MKYFAPFILLALLTMPHNATAQDDLPKTIGRIERISPELDKLLPEGAKIEVLAGGFEWSEGPVWVPKGEYLLFSDIPHNKIVKWKEGEGASTFMERSGYTGDKPFTGPEPGTNGLMLDSEGRLVMCCHGDRCVRRLESGGKRTTLATHHGEKRLNSPNDLVFHDNGDLYFTDPPYGLPKRYNDPARELDFCGVYRLTPAGKLSLVSTDLARPNGIALSPDQKTLYLAQSDSSAPILKSFPVKEDGTLGEGKLFFDGKPLVDKKLPGNPDGMAVDQHGNVWATGFGGITVLSPKGEMLGRIITGEKTANCTFGGPDGKTLFITADMFLCRVKTNVKGAR